jgi:LysM repeat protein
MRPIMVLALAAFVIAGCSLSASRAENDAPIVPVAISQAETEEPAPMQTPRPTSTPRSSGSTGSQTSGSGSAGDMTSCVPRADWAATYRVVSGDMLGSIAQRAGLTTDALASGNCLADANVISVGQVLRLPRVPLPSTATLLPAATATFRPPLSQSPPLRVGSVMISSFLSADAGNFQLIRDETITLVWSAYPAEASYVAFFAMIPGWTLEHALPGSVLIGQDTYLADGAQMGWTVPPGLRHELVAMAHRADGSLLAITEYYLSVRSALAQGQGCIVRVSAPNNLYDQPALTSDVVREIGPEPALFPLGRSINGWWAISLAADQNGSAGYDALAWLPVDAPVITDNEC